MRIPGEDVANLVAEQTPEPGRWLEALVAAGATVYLVEPFLERCCAESDEVRRQFETNVVGPLLLTQGVVRKMIKRRSGKIIFMSSVVGILCGPFVGMYAASKHALEAIAETMRSSIAFAQELHTLFSSSE